MIDDRKPSNPKDSVGSNKLALELVPDTIEAEVALAFLEGALKYGRYNWRISGVRSSIYYAAMKRHQKKWWNGENADKATRVKHLASVMACAGILLDAELCGKLEDDRPPAVDISKLMDSDEMLAKIAHLKQLFASHSPRHYTIKDTANKEATCGSVTPVVTLESLNDLGLPNHELGLSGLLAVEPRKG